MGVNGQKRKNKQGPVPSLEESLPKKFKKDVPVKKPKKSENGVKAKRVKPREEKEVVAEEVAVEVAPHEESDDATPEFGVAKASLFGDIDEDEEDDEFDMCGSSVLD
jgi:hypothetical protein